MSGSTWSWLGGTINVDSASDWTLTSGPNDGVIPQVGDTAINDGTLAGIGLIASALINNGTVEETNNSNPGASTGGDLEINGAVGGTGSMTIEPGATLQIDGSLGAGQEIVFAPGAPETLILGSPTGTIPNPISGFVAGDKIEFSNGITINSDFAPVPTGTTLTVTYHTASGPGAYVLTNVAFSGDGPVEYLTQTDFATGNPDLTLTTFMTWLGANGANFSAPSSWNLGNIVPSVQNFVTFNNSAGGTIGGTGTVQGFNFNNGGTWSLAAGATLVSVENLNIGNGGGGTNSAGNLVIGAGGTILTSGYIFDGTNAGDVAALTINDGGVLDQTAPGSGTAAMEVASAQASGTLAAPTANVLVTGAGSMLNLGSNALYIANSGGDGIVTVSQGGSIIASSFNDNTLDPLSVGSHGNGTLVVTDPGSQATLSGVAYLAHTGTGTLTVANYGSVLIDPDPVGLVGFDVGNGNQNGVGGTGVATVTTNGVLDDDGYLFVGLRGDQGRLNVLNGGTVQVGNTLYVGDGGTITTAGSVAAGTTETASGTVTIGSGGTIELTGGPQTLSYGVYLSTSNDGAGTPENAVATVSGTGALLNTDGNGIAVAQDGTATLTISAGGSVISGTANSNLISSLAIARQGAGTVTVTGSGSELTADGIAYVAKAGSGDLIVENQGSVTVGFDGLGTGGLQIGGGGINSEGSQYVGGAGNVLVTTGGDLFSQNYIQVGNDGASGSLSILSGSTAEAKSRLEIGTTTTVVSGDFLISPFGTTNVTSTTLEGGTGVVTVDAGGLLKADSGNISSAGTAAITVGDGAGAVGALDVTGADATVNANGDGIAVGDLGQGALVVSQGGTVLAGSHFATQGAINIGVNAAISGTVTVTDPGSSIQSVGEIDVGAAGSGSLTVENEGTVTSGASALAPSQGIDIAQLVGGTGSVTVAGSQSLLTNTGEFVVGDAGLAHLSVQAGGTVITSPGTAGGLAGLAIANTAGASGSSGNVSGAGSTLQVGGLLDVGVDGSGVLSISDGALVTAGTLDAGNVASAVGNISVDDADFTVTGDATVADDGTGVMSVLNGATFDAANLTIGNTGDSSGALVVSGDNTVVNVYGDLNVGTSLGTGDLTIGPGAVVDALVVNLQGEVVLENGELDPTVNLINQGQTAGGSGTIAAGDIVDEGVIQAGGSKPSQKLLVVAGTVLGGGPWTINGTAQAQANGGAGILQINAGGTMELTGPVLNAASTTFTDDVTPQSTYTVNNSVLDVNFGDATGVLKLDDIGGFAGTVAAFRAGDKFVITGGTLSNLGISNSNTLTVSDSGNGGTDQIIFSSPVSASGFAVINNNTIQVACFAAGTRIKTETGWAVVEDLRVNDNVVTAETGECESIVWVGQRTVNCGRHPMPETVWPVRVAAGAFGENVPIRDLYLSPGHAVFVNEVLVPVKLLINGTTIAQVKRDRVTYYHVELPRHAVILAEGLTVESYLNLGDRADFANGGETIRLFPNFTARLAPDAAPAWEMHGAAPLVLTGERLETARRMVTRRLGPSRTGTRRLPGVARK